MRNPVAVALIVVGGLVIVGPLMAGADTRTANKDNIAEFYWRHGLSTELPGAMEPARSGPCAWAYWLADAGMVVAGCGRVAACLRCLDRTSTPNPALHLTRGHDAGSGRLRLTSAAGQVRWDVQCG